MWEFPKIGGTKDPTIWGTMLGSPIFGNSHVAVSIYSLCTEPPDPGDRPPELSEVCCYQTLSYHNLLFCRFLL